MKEVFRTTLRLDMDKPAERQAAELLRKQRQQQNETYSELIASAVNAYYGDRNSDTKSFDDNQRDEIRAIVRGEMAAAPLSVGSLLQLLGQAPQPTVHHMRSSPVIICANAYLLAHPIQRISFRWIEQAIVAFCRCCVR